MKEKEAHEKKKDQDKKEEEGEEAEEKEQVEGFCISVGHDVKQIRRRRC